MFATAPTLVVLCDLASGSYIRGSYCPVLRIFREESYPVTSLSIPYYIAVNTSSFNSIRIYLRTEDLQAITDFDPNLNLSCTLHLIAETE